MAGRDGSGITSPGITIIEVPNGAALEGDEVSFKLQRMMRLASHVDTAV
jgi:hypothetical protein